MKSLTVLVAVGLVALSPPGFSRERGEGSVRLEYQYILTGEFDSSIGGIDIGRTDSHVLFLSADYALTDRWSINASLPWIKKRHVGALPHNPVVDFSAFTPDDLSIIDNGEYHSDFQDFYGGVTYLAKQGPFTVEPFISFGIPTNDYPYYAHAAVGRNLWHVPVGTGLSFQPYFSDFFFSGRIAYVFTEKVLGVDTSHWLIHGDISYYLNRHLTPRIFFDIKRADGLVFPEDFVPNGLDNEAWYEHDRIIRHNFVNAGFGVDWNVNEKYQVSFAWFKTIDPDQVNTIERAWRIGFTRRFSRKTR